MVAAILIKTRIKTQTLYPNTHPYTGVCRYKSVVFAFIWMAPINPGAGRWGKYHVLEQRAWHALWHGETVWCTDHSTQRVHELPKHERVTAEHVTRVQPVMNIRQPLFHRGNGLYYGQTPTKGIGKCTILLTSQGRRIKKRRKMTHISKNMVNVEKIRLW